MVTLTSTRNIEASFPPYLITNHEKLGRRKEDDEEIGVFGAEKYFNGVINEDASSRISSISSVRSYDINHHHKNNGDHRQIHQRVPDIEQIQSKIHPSTPSVRSESSWNSRSMLLQNSEKKLNSSRSKSSKMNRMKFLASLGCSCSDKDSVDTKDAGEISFNNNNNHPSYENAIRKPNLVSSIRPSMDLADAINQMNRTPAKIEKARSCDFPCQEGSSSFRSTKSPSGLLTNAPPMIKSPFLGRAEINLCKSPEVFGSSSSLTVLEKGNKTMSFDRRPTMMSWDHTMPQPEEIVFPTGGITHHDSGSDASSDLFEIDSMTGKTNPFRARRLSDDTASSCMTPTHGYAPSEASIQWSVVTASAADYSAMSDCEETTTVRPHTTSRKVLSAKARILDAEIMHRRRSSTSTLLGCKNHKAVNVARDAYIGSPKMMNYEAGRMPFKSDSPTKFQSEVNNNFTDFNSRVGHHSFSTRSPIPRLHSPRNSHLLHIQ
ncbi:hypothetical protein CsatB_019797 [Cannabis sativa]|uniref:Uncharacterized protein n=2 Tax=Cannabis sativa TaxID=3483 RepID=A0AB40E6T4_CANSA|nr:hypothetical protein G4B88_012393 [Cannabis sativa]